MSRFFVRANQTLLSCVLALSLFIFPQSPGHAGGRSLSCLVEALHAQDSSRSSSARPAPAAAIPQTPSAPVLASAHRVQRLSPETLSRLDSLDLRHKVIEVSSVPLSAGSSGNTGPGTGNRAIPRIPRALPPPLAGTASAASLSPSEIRFMQDSISNQALGKDYSVLQNALDLRAGKLKVSDLPPIRVWKDEFGKVWTLDHRRLASFKMAGNIDSIPVVWVSPAEVRQQAFKMTTANEGQSVVMKLGSGLAVMVE